MRWTESEIKLDAAKENILVELGRNPEMQVALFGFTSQASLIHQGVAGDRRPFESALTHMRADNGTDIAAALEAAIDYAGKPQERPTITKILLVTDGLSDPVRAKEAAYRCREYSLAIDAILIDPTDDAISLVTSLTALTSGRWDPVYSTEGLPMLCAAKRQRRPHRSRKRRSRSPECRRRERKSKTRLVSRGDWNSQPCILD